MQLNTEFTGQFVNLHISLKTIFYLLNAATIKLNI